MKLRILLLALVAFALSASTALAHDKGGDKHAKAHEKAQQAKKDKKANRHDAQVCRPAVGVKLRGEITIVEADGFWMIVTKSNRHGERFVADDPTAEGAAVYVGVGEKTKIRRNGKAELTDLAPYDGVKVKLRACKRDLRNDEATPELYAKHVKAKPVATDATESEPDDDGEPKTGTTPSDS